MTWEYRTTSWPTSADDMNWLGSKGWEMICVTTDARMLDLKIAVWKRRKDA